MNFTRRGFLAAAGAAPLLAQPSVCCSAASRSFAPGKSLLRRLRPRSGALALYTEQMVRRCFWVGLLVPVAAVAQPAAKQVFEKVCGACHPVETVTAQK